MRASRRESAQLTGHGIRDGQVDIKKLLEGREGSPDNYQLSLIGSTTDYGVVRHRHNFDQLRYIIDGEFGYGGGRVIPPGHVSYFPEGCHYGPQTRKPGTLMMICQFGGASGHGFSSSKQRRDAAEALRKKGEFAKGVFTWFEAGGQRHNLDSAEAVAREICGGPISYSPSRLGDVVSMNPENFTWVNSLKEPGLSHKWMGTFTERGTGVGFVRMAKGKTWLGGGYDAVELMFVTQGCVECLGEIYPLHSAFEFMPTDRPTAIVAVEETEILRLQLPKF